MPRRRSQSISLFIHAFLVPQFALQVQLVDGVPEVLHRGSDGFYSIVKHDNDGQRLASQGSIAFKVPERQVPVFQVMQLAVKLTS